VRRARVSREIDVRLFVLKFGVPSFLYVIPLGLGEVWDPGLSSISGSALKLR
jgi:hypothetical protein